MANGQYRIGGKVVCEKQFERGIHYKVIHYFVQETRKKITINSYKPCLWSNPYNSHFPEWNQI